jgi:glycine cleavage system H protein
MVPDDLLYTEKHEWVRISGDVGTIGITDYAQSQLGDIVYLDLPSVGAKVKQMESFGVVEAVKAVSDLYAPLSGVVIEVNEEVKSDPSLIKSSPYEKGWLIKVKIDDLGESQKLLKPQDYRALIGE